MSWFIGYVFQGLEVAQYFMSENGGHFRVPCSICSSEQVMNASIIDTVYVGMWIGNVSVNYYRA